MIAAAIDLGTNSFRILIGEHSGSVLTYRRKELITTRLGENLGSTGVIGQPAIERSMDCLRLFKQMMDEEQVAVYRAVATSAVREAANQAEFLNLIKENTGVDVEVICGAEEARLSYQGVMNGLHLQYSPLVADLGGGSIEFNCLDEQHSINMSLPLGAVRATEAEWSKTEIRRVLQPVEAFKEQLAGHPLVFVGGTATSLAAVHLGLAVYDRGKVHGQELSREQVNMIYELLYSTPLAERRLIPGLQPERADIIVKGALIIREAMDLLGRDILQVSETDILEGIIWSMDR